MTQTRSLLKAENGRLRQEIGELEAAGERLRQRVLELEVQTAKGEPLAPSESDSIAVKPVPLQRSSMEAYAGILIAALLALFTITWSFRVFLFLVLIFLCADFCWRSPFTLRWPKRARALICVLVVGLVIRVGYFNVKTAYLEEAFPADANYLIEWGPPKEGSRVSFAKSKDDPGEIIGKAESYLKVDGTKLKRYRDKYKIWAAIFTYDGTIEYKDVQLGGSSGLFDVADGPIDITVPWNEHFKWRLTHHWRGTDYVVLLVPMKITSPSFRTIREALDQGSVQIALKTGPP